MKRLLVGAVLAAFSHPAVAHDNYPVECCSGQDCHLVPANTVRKIGNYWHVQTADGELRYPPERVREPIDGDFHACWFPGTTIIFCFFPAAGGV